MRTISNLPVRGFTIRTTDPNGRTGWAAVRDSESNRSPSAVFRPLNSGPYQLALPTQVLMGLTGSLLKAVRGASITGAMRNISGTQRMAAQIMKSGRFIVLCVCYNFPKSVAEKPHYVNQFLRKTYPLTH